MPKTSAAKMSLLIFIAESHDMHPNGVPCSKRRGYVLLVILSEAKNPVKSWKTNLGVPLPMGKVGLYSRGNRLRYARRSPPRTEPCSATPWSLSLTRKIIHEHSALRSVYNIKKFSRRNYKSTSRKALDVACH